MPLIFASSRSPCWTCLPKLGGFRRSVLTKHCSCRSTCDRDVGHGLGESLRGFLRQVVPDAAGDEPVLIPAGELLRITTWIRVRRTIRIPFQGDGRDRDDRKFGKPLFQIVIFRLAFSQAEPPAVVMD